MKFSITIPAFKQQYLAEAIDSVLKQTFLDFELIIVDDCSPEDLKSVVDKFLDSRIRYYRNAANCGAINVVDNWNICLSYCTGEYVICMGDDDRLLPCCLEEYKKIIEKYPGLEVYHALSEIIDENSNVFNIQVSRPEWESAFSLIWHRWTCRDLQFIGDFLYDVKRLRNHGGYYKVPLAWGSDDITAARAALSKGIANTQVPCFQYRSNRLSITGSAFYDIKINAISLEKNWYLDNVINNPKNPSDCLYGTLLNEIIDKRYKNKIKAIIRNDLRCNKSTVFQWLRKTNKLNLAKSFVIKEFILSYFVH